jgi:diguanylate cyclase (GGDEF)-like protein
MSFCQPWRVQEGSQEHLAGEVAHLTEELEACRKVAAEHLRQIGILEFAMQAMSYSLDPAQVLQTATGLAATLASPPGGGARRAVYCEISGETMTITTDSDDTGASAVGTTMLIADHPLLPMAITTGQAVSGPLDVALAGPSALQVIVVFGITHAACVPVRIHGTIHGLLVVASRGHPIPADLVDRLRGVGALTEIAYTNALRHRDAETDATTDPLTGLANRRGFEQALERLGTRRPFALLAIDIDNLKTVNDHHGHAAGDSLLVAVATAIANVARKDETLARMGGDEFVLLIPVAAGDAPTSVGARMREVVAGLDLPTGPTSVSVGWALGTSADDPHVVLERADAMLYAAKAAEPHAAPVPPPEQLSMARPARFGA